MKYKVAFTVSDRNGEKSLLSVSHETEWMLGSTPIYAAMFLNTGSKSKT